ncbi:SRPBCC family protein [Phytomonospora endophytica]|uniref:SRPBCC family protein n=1 Tax=Phytomonospora endophytica TaxID=714109 RepID=A0A841FZ06_9ACTN|nr:SRPBCC family protein [Phytomonospora endophytica]MBB6039973.1 hypothetical protein [Phytomonospora endophytica]
MPRQHPSLIAAFLLDMRPEEAFVLFTPLGEREWAEGWDPVFPAEPDDDSAPGTVFESRPHGHSPHGATWIVVDREPGRRIRYARVIPGRNAGTVTVSLGAVGDRTAVTVAYDLTALTPEGRTELDAFAAAYPAFIDEWRRAILRVRPGPPGRRPV